MRQHSVGNARAIVSDAQMHATFGMETRQRQDRCSLTGLFRVVNQVLQCAFEGILVRADAKAGIGYRIRKYGSFK